MNPKAKVVTLWTVMLSIALADGYLTWLNTPDLAMEGNPLVMVFGLGWGALFVSNALFFVIYAFTTWYCFVCFSPPPIEAEGCLDYYGKLFFGRPCPNWQTFFFKLVWPTSWRGLVVVFGYLIAVSIPAARAVLVVEWLMVTFGGYPHWYVKLSNAVPFGRVEFVVYILVAGVSYIWYFKKLYRKNQRMLADAAKAELPCESI